MKEWENAFSLEGTHEKVGDVRTLWNLELVGHLSNFLFNLIWPIKTAYKLLIGSFKHRLLVVGMKLQKYKVGNLMLNVLKKE